MRYIIITTNLFRKAACLLEQNQGLWSGAGSSGAVCIHAAILPNNKLLCFERPHKDQYPLNTQTDGMLSTEIDLIKTKNIDGSWTCSFISINLIKNPFCAGHSVLKNGAIFVGGGDNQSSTDMTFIGPLRGATYFIFILVMKMAELL
jgi:hypothetical protein